MLHALDLQETPATDHLLGSEDIKHAERVLGGPVAYHHVTREAKCVADDMAHCVLAVEGDVTYMHGDVPGDAPSN